MRTLLVFALALAACGGQAPIEGEAGRIELAVAPLTLPGITNACYGLSVKNEALESVWSRSGLCADRYGDGRSALTYVAPCDATDTNNDTVATNTVVLTIEGLFAPGPVSDFINPCAPPFGDGCSLQATCRENADTRVEFNLTVMRQANQGFFDIAVTFEDIFCSAKVDCAYPATDGSPERPIELVFDPVTGQRVQSIVWAFACTDGDPGGQTQSATHLYMDDVVLRCGETSYPIDAAAGPGNLYPNGVGAPAPIVQAMVFEGRELVRNGEADADKLYWNVALGLNEAFFELEPPAQAPTCVLETKATAHKGPFTEGTSPLNTNYPYVMVSVPINSGADIVCTQHPLDGEAPHAGVRTAYTGPNVDMTGFATATFGNVLYVGAAGVESAPIDFDECTVLAPCGDHTTCTDLSGGYACTCVAGYEGNAYTTGCVDIDECDNERDNCHIDATCTNTPGGFDCECLPGYEGDGESCVDLDGCLVGNGGCLADASCENEPGPEVTCTCLPGYDGDGVDCVDLDGCITANGGCSANATCENEPGPEVTCTCLPGYDGDGVTCVDLDGCLVGNGGCSTNASCQNQAGPNVTCECLTGFTGNGLVCDDIDECLSNNGGCSANAACNNTPGTRTCECLPGYSGDGFMCTDLDGCLTNNGGCSANASCQNQAGPNVICQCLPGFSGDGLTCSDVNECLTNNGGCSANAACNNTPGGRTCTCNGGFSGDGLTCVQGLVISANTTDYSVFSAAGSPATPRAIVVTVNAGVTVSASSSSVAAFRTGNLPAGSTVRVVNLGNIYGAGGRGGNAGDNNFAAAAGSAGGDAIAASVPLTVDNQGYIFGGGGGGGGGNLCTRSNVLACGGSGGGGRGQVGGGSGSKGTCESGAAYPNGTSGGGGSVSGAGGGGSGASSGYYPNQFGSPFYCTSGHGGAGGDWGQAGQASGQAILDGGVQYAANAGGAAGYAVRLSNGATVTWQAGNTSDRVKGLAQ